MAVGPCGEGAGAMAGAQVTPRLIQVAGDGTRSTPMKKLCVCGKTVKVTDRKWA